MVDDALYFVYTSPLAGGGGGAVSPSGDPTEEAPAYSSRVMESIAGGVRPTTRLCWAIYAGMKSDSYLVMILQLEQLEKQ